MEQQCTEERLPKAAPICLFLGHLRQEEEALDQPVEANNKLLLTKWSISSDPSKRTSTHQDNRCGQHAIDRPTHLRSCSASPKY